MPNETSTTDLLAILRASQDRLTAALGELGDDDVAGPSYDDDWSIGQVASHLGSGAEIFALFLEAGRSGSPSPGPEEMQPIWARWDAKSPVEQALDSLATNAAFHDRIDALSEEEREQWRLDLFGADRTLSDFLRMRLSEHALHTWDVTVMADPALGVPEDAAAVIVDNLAMIAGWSGKAPDAPLAVAVRTTDPKHALVLHLGPDAVSLSSDPGQVDAELSLPTEAFVRLVYGRLDPDHTPSSVTARGVDLDQLRMAFPGV